MDKRLGLTVVLSALALVWTGCDDDDDPMCGGDSGIVCPPDGGGDEDAGVDAGPEADSGPRTCTPNPADGRAAGAACRSGTACVGTLECQQAAMGPYPSRLEDGSPGPNFGIALNPGTLCTELCELDGPNTCGDCASCSNGGRVGRVSFVADISPDGQTAYGFCRPNCTPSPTDNGGCREGYTCDLRTSTCVEACTDDNWCRIIGYEDVDGDGTLDFIYDENSTATCNQTTGRCEVQGTPGAGAGDSCTTDSDCMDDGLCLRGEGIPEGFCTKLDCNVEGFGCGAGETCSLRGLGGDLSWCLPACTVGAEPEADRLGEGGHGQGCDPGQACIWDGRSEAPNGGCVPSEYNDITTPNVGSPCETSADCYSPFGYGVCLAAGVCAIQNCAGEATSILPGVTTTTRVCDPDANEICVLAGGTPQAPDTLCLLTCDSADDCAEGLACNFGLLTGGDGPTGVCFGFCSADSDCRSGESCLNEAGGACGADDECTCQVPAQEPECIDDDGCPDDQVCLNAGGDACTGAADDCTCQEPAEEPECIDDDGCPDDQVCLNAGGDACTGAADDCTCQDPAETPE